MAKINTNIMPAR